MAADAKKAEKVKTTNAPSVKDHPEMAKALGKCEQISTADNRQCAKTLNGNEHAAMAKP